MIIGRKKEIEMLRDAYESELPRHIIHLSGRHYHHLIISVSSAYNPCSFHLLRVFFRTRIFRGLTRMLRSVSDYHHLIKSVGFVKSVFVSSPPSFFFEHGFIGLTRMLRFCGGTVFQTALLFMVIVPRLRPGLLSLCSVLASSQTYQQSTKQQDN